MQTDLSQDSNILRFQQDFEILSLEKRDAFKDAWRVFGTEAERPLEELPRKTSVQRGFADFLILGGGRQGKGTVPFSGAETDGLSEAMAEYFQF